MEVLQGDPLARTKGIHKGCGGAELEIILLE